MSLNGGLNRINTIEVKELTKIYDKNVKAVNGVSFDVKKGEILGFLGPNGAGKTTTLNMLSTLLKPTSGTAKINGHDILKEPDAVRRSIGYVFQDTHYRHIPLFQFSFHAFHCSGV